VLGLFELASASACAASATSSSQHQNYAQSDSQDSDEAETPAMLCLDEAVDDMLAEIPVGKNAHVVWWTQLTGLICDDLHGQSILDQPGKLSKCLRAREQAADSRARGLSYLQRLLRACDHAVVQRALMVAFDAHRSAAATTLSSSAKESRSSKFLSLTASHPLQGLSGSGAARLSSVYRSFTALYRTLVQRLVDPRADLGLRLLVVDQLAFAPQPHDLTRLLIRSRALPALAALERELSLRLGLASALQLDENQTQQQEQARPPSSPSPRPSGPGSVSATPALPAASPAATTVGVHDEDSESDAVSKAKLKMLRQGHARVFAVISALTAQVCLCTGLVSHFIK
jgi:hypothetical protein